MSFKDYKFSESILEGIKAIGYTKSTPIQEQAIPIVLNGNDIMGIAQTGTGKTAAFLLPILEKLLHRKSDSIGALIITPTRELALQIDQHLMGLSYFTSATSISIYGGGDGSDFGKQKTALTKGADFVIATPGKLISHFNLGYVNVDELQFLVLDEADKMLDMGFYEDIIKITGFLPKKRQTLMFSATMPQKIRQLAKTILSQPKEINIALSKPPEGIFQGAFRVYGPQKIDLIQHLVKVGKAESILIFSSTKKNVKEIRKALSKVSDDVAEIHSDLEQAEREKVLTGFKNNKIKVLVATDVMSRGIDVEGIDLVISYDVPKDPEDYIHRIGRTARASKKGIAFTFITQSDYSYFKKIQELVGSSMIKWLKLPGDVGEGPQAFKTYHNKKGVKRKKFKT